MTLKTIQEILGSLPNPLDACYRINCNQDTTFTIERFPDGIPDPVKPNKKIGVIIAGIFKDKENR